MIWVDRNEITPQIAWRNAIGITIPVVAGVLRGRPDYGVVGSFGAMDVSYSDGHDPYALRMRRMLAASGVAMAAIIAGSMSGHYPAAAVAIVVTWAFAAGLLVAVHSTAADIGQLSLVLMLVYSGQSVPLSEAINFGLFAAAGGLLQMLLSIAFWPVRRHEPELRLLAGLYTDLSRITSSMCCLPRLRHSAGGQRKHATSSVVWGARVPFSTSEACRCWRTRSERGSASGCFGASGTVGAEIPSRHNGLLSWTSASAPHPAFSPISEICCRAGKHTQVRRRLPSCRIPRNGSG